MIDKYEAVTTSKEHERRLWMELRGGSDIKAEKGYGCRVVLKTSTPIFTSFRDGLKQKRALRKQELLSDINPRKLCGC